VLVIDTSEALARDELGDDEAGSTAPGEPWPKTSSGGADNVTDNDDEDEPDGGRP
jgi:hypothetical protein